MNIRRAAAIVTAAVAILFGTASCGIYSFSGTSIQPDVRTITINYFEYKALQVNPTLSNDLTEALRQRFRQMTSLEQVDQEGDLEITGEITGYSVSASSVTAQEVAAQNRLTVTVRVSFMNRKYPEDDFEGSTFSGYADFDSSQSLDAVQSTLCEEIVDKLWRSSAEWWTSTPGTGPPGWNSAAAWRSSARCPKARSRARRCTSPPADCSTSS